MSQYLANESVKPTKSLIARREGEICSVSNKLDAKYIYDDMGNYPRNYLPEPNRTSNRKLQKALMDGLAVYNKLLNMKFDDKMLKDTLCIARASLEYDGEISQGSETYHLSPLQVCTDALKQRLVS